MLDIKFIKENVELIKEAVQKKHLDFSVEELLKVEQTRTQLLSVVESHRAEHNKVNEQIAGVSDIKMREQLILEMRLLKEHLKENEEQLKKVMTEWQTLMLQVPNVPDISVPEGKNDQDNIEIRTWGEKPNFSFKPKDHIALLENLDLVDFERGTKVVGFRGYFLKGDLIKLQFALNQYVLDEITKKGFELFIAPSLVRGENFLATGHFPAGKEDVYKTQDDLYLTGTSEVSMMGFHSDEILKEEDLPKKYASFSACFRREAGNYGKDTKGLFRVHEFQKIEQFILCRASHEETVKLHEEITKNAEEILQSLNLAHRVVVNCAGDITQGAVKTYDIECWFPSEDKYRETHSSSYYHDFQSRRAKIRYKDVDGKIRYVHSLNNTAIAGPRILIPIIENNQQEDGSIKIPKVLQKYFGKEIIQKS